MDGSVSDYQQLIAGVTSGTEVHVLNSAQDAVTQITNTLLGRSGISSLQIVSHGEAGGLDFGGDRLNLGDLPGYTAQLQSWGNALTEDADLLLYGCNVASGEVGKAFVQILGQLTGADVAASDDLTGGGALGGDWTLEYQTGQIETAGLNAVDYNSVLAIFTVMNSNDTGAGSLRNAITQANATAGTDNINFSSFNIFGSITLQSALPNLSESVNIRYDPNPLFFFSAYQTIQANTTGAFNILTIDPGQTVSITGLAISNGSNGILNNGTLSVFRSLFSGNTLSGISNGGAINVVYESTFSGNATGISTGDLSTVTTINSNTFSGNSGIGISNTGGSITLITNNTFSGNGIGLANSPSEGVANVSEFVNNTIAGNTNVGISNTATIGKLFNNLLVSNGDNTVGGTVTNQGNNLSGTYDSVGVASALTFNGGSTRTHALLSGSAAIDTGDNSKIPASVPNDQRGSGFTRVLGGIVDVGAFEALPLPSLSVAAGITPVENTPTNGSYTFTLSSAPTSPLTINFNVAGSADRGSDYTLTGGAGITSIGANSFVIAAGATSATLTVQVIDDSLEEPDETIQLTLANGTGYALGGTPSSTLTIAANDSATPIVLPPIVLPPIVIPVAVATPIFTVFQLQQTFTLSKSTQKLLATQLVGLQQLFDEEYYLNQNRDVYTAFAKGSFQSGFQHFVQFGQFEGRNPSSLYNEQTYLSQNTDVATAVTSGGFRCGFQHFVQFGQYEGRNFSSLFNEQTYLSQNTDVAAAEASAVESSTSCSLALRRDGCLSSRCLTNPTT